MHQATGSKEIRPKSYENYMPTLDNLMFLLDIYGAIEFSCAVALTEMHGSMDRDSVEIVVQMCAANMVIYCMQATGWSKYTGQKIFCPNEVLPLQVLIT